MRSQNDRMEITFYKDDLTADTFSENNAASDLELDFPLSELSYNIKRETEIKHLASEYSLASFTEVQPSCSNSHPNSLDLESLPGPSCDSTSSRNCLSFSECFLDSTPNKCYTKNLVCAYSSTSALHTIPRRPKKNLKVWPQNSVGSSDWTPSQSNDSMNETSNFDYSKASRTPDSEVFESDLSVPVINTQVMSVLSDQELVATESPRSLLRNSDAKPYDYLLKILLVGDSDVGKHEILDNLEDEAPGDTSFTSGPAHKTTTLLLDGKRVRLQVWDTSGQGRFCTVLRSYSRGAQGVLLVFDLTNRWSFDGLDRWLKEIENHAPGVPKVLVGNRLHLEFRRAIQIEEAETYARRNGMSYFEISPLCNYNVMESFGELARRALRRNGMERLWRAHQVPTLQELCCRAIVSSTSVYGIDKLPLPSSIRTHLRSYAVATAHSRVKSKSKSFRKKKSILSPFNQTCVGKKKMCSLM
ncbi:ras-related protein Rab-40C-like isoform X2 [Artemia franciscana]|uniref:SOCS box domain-containing protein n=1 Tax=Artemia franciscana TaxID=6661 RepID=A0AA88I2K5_ARTSF|nr:hypothetical protein QYM36_009121 [Artemia franciscana]